MKAFVDNLHKKKCKGRYLEWGAWYQAQIYFYFQKSRWALQTLSDSERSPWLAE